ncbi:MAG: glutathione peroxidase [SAR86 cluster bacterium]|jgi:glutathione peroxidase|nr:glutathione peroxidase [SAR86 cluster bacterium]
MTKNIYQFSCEDSSGQAVHLSDYEGKALLIVNTASQCGFTPQYEGLEKLQQKFDSDKFSVLAFPCNQFGGQEPGSNEEIAEFCSLNYSNTFPVFSKVEVNGAEAHPLFEFLTKEKKGLLGSEKIKWNFTKFLINKAGEPVARYAPSTTPEKIELDIEKLI